MDLAVRPRGGADDGRWSRLSPATASGSCVRWADLIEANGRELGIIETIDAGKPITDTVGLDMPETAACIRWHAEAIDKLYGQVAPSPEGTIATITREPVGVVGAVIPWNYPAQMAAWKLGPALATGNTIVIKPASTTSLSLLRIAELGAEAGIPDGVLNVVTGPGDTVGEAIGRHPDVDCVAFTGSTEVGRRLPPLRGRDEPQARAARARRQEPAARVRRRRGPRRGRRQRRDRDLLEHGRELLGRVATHRPPLAQGRAARGGRRGARLVARRRPARPGDPDRGADLPRPDGARARVRAGGRAEGARVVTGGERILEETGGWFVPPTIFDNVRNDMTIAREEIFGPVLSVIEFDTEAEAVAIANDTPYGLAASLYTEDLNVAHRVARELRAGVVGVNAYSEGDMTTPFGGYKLSGFGGHDKSVHAHDQYTETKTIWIQLRGA